MNVRNDEADTALNEARMHVQQAIEHLAKIVTNKDLIEVYEDECQEKINASFCNLLHIRNNLR